MRFTKEHIEQARYADLAGFLLDNYPEDFTESDNGLRMKDDHSVTIKRGTGIYRDWAENKQGNGISFLQEYYGYTFQEAVQALLEGYTMDKQLIVKKEARQQEPLRALELPERFTGEPRNLYAYLMSRAIPKETIRQLLDHNVMYQDSHYNVVFVNPKKTCYEVRGTNTYRNEPYKRVGLARSDEFWFLSIGTAPRPVFITESAIDAISLYELKNHEPGVYVSMHGVGNHQIIDRIMEHEIDVFLAVDNDDAGQACREKYFDLRPLIPQNKDWNEDLQSLR